MSTKGWRKFPHPDKAYEYPGDALKKNWARLHQGDCEPWPESADVQDAWRAYHAGDFAKAVDLGIKAGGAGISAANKAAMIYATYLVDDEDEKAELFQQIIERAETQQAQMPDAANAWYFHAYALGRYSQLISVGEALAKGLGGKIRSSLEKTLEIAPDHAEAHIALAAFQAEVIDKVGSLVGNLTYGAKKDSAVEHFEQALALIPFSAIARMEMANGLVMLFGKSRMKKAEELYAEAAECEPVEAMERLDVEAAKAELED
ncbi:hypothetical protein GCM10025771_26070 [Niveibacterium umoris]|uniref:Tetratricopeptide (TPR) repeat protein n=1 Tax=Niveibacterium umoris TaxID=1193620 RepID=A0A840BIN9_9RHOO|nr:hypothetical protein [Niveibacterium umoris]MBB4012204.1 tetratricopeptide (TPR) repeat protein [Niveibacterium umoris]